MTRLLLLIGSVTPLLYFGTILAASALYPGYSHLTQYASELGMAGRESAALFNGGIFATGVTVLAAAVGIQRVLARETSGRVWSTLGAIALGLFGIGLFMGALFPMPDPRHGGFGLGMGIHLAPFLLAVPMWRIPEQRLVARFLVVTGIAMAFFLVLMFGVGGLVTRGNVGLFQRLYGLTVFPWIGLLCYALANRRR